MGEEYLFSLVGSLGFPIVVAGYMIIKVDKTMENMTDILNKLVVLIDKKEG